jgi:HlyD family secretion protein
VADLFRKKALEKLSSPEQLDQLLQITRPKGWVTLLALGTLLIWAVIWGIWGTVETTVTGRGILMKKGGVFSITAQGAGVVQNLYFSQNDTVEMGQIIARVAQPELQQKIKNAKNHIKDLELKRDKTAKFGTRDTQLESRSLEQRHQNLMVDNAVEKDRIVWLKARLLDQERLLKLGLITKQDKFKTKEQINNAKEQIRQNGNKLKQLDIKKLQIANNIQQKLLTIEDQLNVDKGTLLSLQSQFNLTSMVISPYNGTIVGVGVQLGTRVSRGSPVVTLEIEGMDAGFLEAVLFVPPDEGKKIKPGIVAHISPTTFSVDKYGYIISLVNFVSPFPATSADMQRVLQNKEMVSMLSKEGPPYEVRAVLVRDPNTPSKFKWTSSQGPDQEIAPGSILFASAVVRRRRPISLVIPLMKHYLLGVGDEKRDEGL